MRKIKIGMANVNTTVGAFGSNTNKVLAFTQEMAKQKCTIGCFAEQVVGGYPAEDLVQWRSFQDKQLDQLNRILDMTAKPKLDFPTVFTVGIMVQIGGSIYNSIAVLCDGNLLGIVPKQKLASDTVFYEKR